MKNATMFKILAVLLLFTSFSFAQVDSLVYEVVQTNPPLGVAPTPAAGFCSTSGGALGCTNVQRYYRLDAAIGTNSIEGTWLSAGDDVAPLLQGFGIDSIFATFTNSNTYTVLIVDINNVQSTLTGTYATAVSGIGNISTITLNQLTPTTLTSAGIFEVKNFPNSIEDEENIINQFSLEQNYPNPFNPSTTIAFQLGKSSDVTIKIYNIAGQEVAVAANRFFATGRHEVVFNASELTSGAYFYKISAGDFTAIRQMMLVK